MVTNNDLHIVEEPFEPQNNLIETQTYSTELATQSKTTTSPMKVTDTTIDIQHHLLGLPRQQHHL